MAIISVPYFIFSSGEKGVHGLDWGVKYVSPGWDKPEIVNRLYTDLVRQFGLSPGLKIPEKKGYGLILMPLPASSHEQALMGFFWPYHDSASQGRRSNIALICCKLPASKLRQKAITPDQVSEALMRLPGFDTLPLRKEDRAPEYQHRPEVLNFDESSLVSIEIKSEKFPCWPSQTEAFLSVSGMTERFTLKNKQTSSPSATPISPVFKNLTVKAGVGLAVLLFIGGLYFIFSGGPDKKSNHPLSQSGSAEKNLSVTVTTDSSLHQPVSKETRTTYQQFLNSINALIRQTGAQKITLQKDLFIDGRTITDLDAWDLDSASKEIFKRFTYAEIHPEKKLLRPNATACVLNVAIEKIVLDRNSATNRYRPLELITRMPMDVLGEWPEKCRVDMKSTPSKAVLKSDDLTVFIDSRIKKNGNEQTISHLQQSIAFLVPTNIGDVYQVFYPGTDFKSISRQKGLFFRKEQLKYVSMENYINAFSETFERPNPDNKKHWIIQSEYVQSQILEVAVQHKKNDTQSVGQISESAIIEFLGNYLWKGM